MSRRILVLGATSLIGRRLLAGRRPSDVELVCMSRAPRFIDGPSSVKWIAADLGASGLAQRLPPADTILSLSPIWLLGPALPALLSTGATLLVAFSSTSRLTKAASPVVAERAVAQRLADGEAAVEAVCGAAGVAWTILRPTMIYDEGEDANVSRLAALIVRFGVLPLSGRGEGLRQPVHAADLAAAVWQALAATASFGRTYDLPGAETLTYRQMASRIFEALGKRPRLLSLPPPLWRLGLALASPWLPGATAAMGRAYGRGPDLRHRSGRAGFRLRPPPVPTGVPAASLRLMHGQFVAGRVEEMEAATAGEGEDRLDDLGAPAARTRPSVASRCWA